MVIINLLPDIIKIKEDADGPIEDPAKDLFKSDSLKKINFNLLKL